MWCLWRSWLARQIVALEAESSNLSRHPTKDRTGAFLHGLFFYNGSSPSGKARDFDSRIREFEPRRPNHSSSCMNVQGELLFCRGDHWSPADACGNGKPSGRIWNPPLQSPLGPLCEGAPPAGGGGENCTAARNISGYDKVFFVPSLQRRNRRNYKLLDKNTFLHKFGGVPFALRAYLCYNK